MTIYLTDRIVTFAQIHERVVVCAHILERLNRDREKGRGREGGREGGRPCER